MPLYTYEGIDGAGKSTAIRATKEQYPDAVYTTEPDDDTAYGQAVRHAIKDDATPPMAVFCSFLADHANHLATVVRPALARDALVVSDRYTDSRYAYQSYALEDVVANPDSCLADFEAYLADASFPEVSFTDIAIGASPEALLFVFFTRAFNGGDDGLHPAFHEGDYTVNLQHALGEYDSPLVDAARDPYAWFNTIRGYDDSLAWIQSRQEYEEWSILPDTTILLDMPVEESFRRKAGDDKETFEKRDFLTAVRDNYHELAETTARYEVVTAHHPHLGVEESQDRVCDACLNILNTQR